MYVLFMLVYMALVVFSLWSMCHLGTV